VEKIGEESQVGTQTRQGEACFHAVLCGLQPLVLQRDLNIQNEPGHKRVADVGHKGVSTHLLNLLTVTFRWERPSDPAPLSGCREGRETRLTARAPKGEEPRPNTNEQEPRETHPHKTGTRHTHTGQPRRPPNRQLQVVGSELPRSSAAGTGIPSPSARRNRGDAHAKPTATNRVAISDVH
jgi:hypothetical protein